MDHEIPSHPSGRRVGTRWPVDPAVERDIAKLRADLANAEALVVRPATAERMLSVTHKALYDLMNAGELQSFTEGSRRFITVQSIRDYLARRLAAFPVKPPKPRRRRGGER
jgi:hypothetical protein